VRTAQKSAEAVVAKKAGESRKERRAKEPRDRPEKPDPSTLRFQHTMAGRGGLNPAAGFNRRMRKTARPVVWEGHGAQSLRPDPIIRAASRLAKDTLPGSAPPSCTLRRLRGACHEIGVCCFAAGAGLDERVDKARDGAA
jgi:hypothetical protein